MTFKYNHVIIYSIAYYILSTLRSRSPEGPPHRLSNKARRILGSVATIGLMWGVLNADDAIDAHSDQQTAATNAANFRAAGNNGAADYLNKEATKAQEEMMSKAGNAGILIVSGALLAGAVALLKPEQEDQHTALAQPLATPTEPPVPSPVPSPTELPPDVYKNFPPPSSGERNRPMY